MSDHETSQLRHQLLEQYAQLKKEHGSFFAMLAASGELENPSNLEKQIKCKKLFDRPYKSGSAISELPKVWRDKIEAIRTSTAGAKAIIAYQELSLREETPSIIEARTYLKRFLENKLRIAFSEELDASVKDVFTKTKRPKKKRLSAYEKEELAFETSENNGVTFSVTDEETDKHLVQFREELREAIWAETTLPRLKEPEEPQRLPHIYSVVRELLSKQEKTVGAPTTQTKPSESTPAASSATDWRTRAATPSAPPHSER